MGFVEEARAARAAAEGARAAYRGRVARAERSFLEARETRAESERSLEDALGSALLIARFKSLRLYPDRIECKGEAIVEDESTLLEVPDMLESLKIGGLTNKLEQQ